MLHRGLVSISYLTDTWRQICAAFVTSRKFLARLEKLVWISRDMLCRVVINSDKVSQRRVNFTDLLMMKNFVRFFLSVVFLSWFCGELRRLLFSFTRGMLAWNLSENESRIKFYFHLNYALYLVYRLFHYELLLFVQRLKFGLFIKHCVFNSGDSLLSKSSIFLISIEFYYELNYMN